MINLKLIKIKYLMIIIFLDFQIKGIYYLGGNLYYFGLEYDYVYNFELKNWINFRQINIYFELRYLFLENE